MLKGSVSMSSTLASGFEGVLLGGVPGGVRGDISDDEARELIPEVEEESEFSDLGMTLLSKSLGELRESDLITVEHVTEGVLTEVVVFRVSYEILCFGGKF